jgi:hypothetical protein
MGLVTAAFKLKRKDIQDRYQHEINRMYASWSWNWLCWAFAEMRDNPFRSISQEYLVNMARRIGSGAVWSDSRAIQQALILHLVSYQM